MTIAVMVTKNWQGGTWALGLAILVGGCGSDDAASGPTSGSGGAETSSSAGGSGGSGGAGGSPSGAQGGNGGNGGAGGGATTQWQGEVPDLNNDPLCLMPGQIGPAATEAGHWYAVRLTPPSYPYEVSEVVYELTGGGTCDTTVAHEVAVWVESATAPSGTPVGAQTLSTPASGANEDVRVVTHALSPPLALASGEHLFVAVQLPLVMQSCIAVCYGATVTDRDYWSNSAVAPYPWSTLASSSLDVHARIGANGSP